MKIKVSEKRLKTIIRHMVVEEIKRRRQEEAKKLFRSDSINTILENPLNSSDTNKFLLHEGIDLDEYDHVISLNDNHENVVDTSVISNPTYWKMGKYDVISIFKREFFKAINGKNIDGNPLVYTLKGMYGWKWANPNDLELLLGKFVQITQKLNQYFDVIIKSSSENKLLNETILDTVSNHIKHGQMITDYFYKINVEYAEQCIDYNSILSDNQGDIKEAKYVYNEIVYAINHPTDKGKQPFYISSKHIPKEHLKYVQLVATMKNRYSFEQMANLIDGKSVLIIDDTISSGATVSQCVQSITEIYNPKSVVILTMFSPLSSQNLKYQPYKGKKIEITQDDLKQD